MSCRVVLLRMQRDGHIRLPPPRRPGRGGKLRTHRTPQAEPQPALGVPAGQLRYFARPEGFPLALFGFDAAAWKTAKRDRFIGATDR